MSYTHKVIYSYITVYHRITHRYIQLQSVWDVRSPPDTQPKKIAALPKPNVAGAANSSSEDVLCIFSN